MSEPKFKSAAEWVNDQWPTGYDSRVATVSTVLLIQRDALDAVREFSEKELVRQLNIRAVPEVASALQEIIDYLDRNRP